MALPRDITAPVVSELMELAGRIDIYKANKMLRWRKMNLCGGKRFKKEKARYEIELEEDQDTRNDLAF